MDQADVLADRVRVKLAVSLAEIIAGVSDDIERLSQVLLTLQRKVTSYTRPHSGHIDAPFS